MVAAEKLDGPVESLFDMQDRLSRAVLHSLNLKLPTPSRGVIQRRDLQAFECYARELYETAIREEPDHAKALAGLAALHAMRVTFTTDSVELQEASEYARRSIAADPLLADPYVWLGYALMREGRMDEAFELELKVAELDPGDGYAPYFAGCVQQFRGRPAEALPFFQRAVKREPPHGFAWRALGSAHHSLGHLSECQWCIERAIAMEHQPGAQPTAGAHGFLGECFRLQGRLSEARRACLEGIEAVEQSDHMYRDTFRAICLCCLARTALDAGDPIAAHAALTQVLVHLFRHPGSGWSRTVRRRRTITGRGEASLPRSRPLQLLTALDVQRRNHACRTRTGSKFPGSHDSCCRSHRCRR
ncbi:hypothetical protein BH18ACI5_BH18ACI5_21010 [soil metagenome]